jgi:hypothetical protein
MLLAAYYVETTTDLLTRTGMTHEMGHLHAGLLIYVGMQMLLRTRRASSIALQAVIGAEIVNEILQRAYYGSWRWPDTLGDVALTVFWPTILYAAARYRRARWAIQARRAASERSALAPASARHIA